MKWLVRGLLGIALISLTPGTTSAQLIGVTDYVNGGILRLDPTTGAAQAPLVANGGVITPSAMTVGPDNVLYVSNQFGNFVSRHDRVTGAQIAAPIFLPANYQPGGLRFGTDGELYIARIVDQTAAPNSGAGGIDRYNLGTNTLTPVVGGLTAPTSFEFAADGDLLISEFNGGFGRITRFDTATTTPSVIVNTGSGGLQAPAGVRLGADGNLYVADVLNFAIRRYTQAGVPVGTGVFATGPGLDNPADLLFNDGFMYVANLGANFGSPLGFVSRFDATTGVFDASFVSPFIQGASSLVLVPVPEPTSLALAGLGALAIGARRRKTRKV